MMKANSMTTSPSKSWKTKASSMTTKSKAVKQFKDDYAFEEFDGKSEFNDDQVEGRSNSLKMITLSKCSKMTTSFREDFISDKISF